jgi:hypothetical protein
VTFIEKGGLESSFPQVAGLGVPLIEVLRVIAVNPLKCATQRKFIFGNGDEMNVIVHQAVSPNSDHVFDALRSEHSDICVAIYVIQKDICLSIAALRDMVWISWQGNSMRS